MGIVFKPKMRMEMEQQVMYMIKDCQKMVNRITRVLTNHKLTRMTIKLKKQRRMTIRKKTRTKLLQEIQLITKIMVE